MISEELRKELIKSKELNVIYKESFNNLIYRVLLEDNINLTDEDGWSLLFHSVIYDLKDLAKLLLDNGIDVNAQTKNGNTALLKATMDKNKKLVELLLRYGAYVDVKNKNGNTALYYAKFYECQDAVNLLENANSIVDEEKTLKEEVKRLIKM